MGDKDEYDKAIADLNEAIRLDPKNPLAYGFRAEVWASKKDFDKSIADCSEAIRLDPKNCWLLGNRAAAWKVKKDYSKALADYDEAVRLAPKNAGALNSQALLLATCPDAKHRDGKRAIESATRACELTGWKDPYKLATLAAAYAESGNFPKAIEWQQTANTLYASEEVKKRG
jgi:tetratricopeptide (TPR) repeat protein